MNEKSKKILIVLLIFFALVFVSIFLFFKFNKKKQVVVETPVVEVEEEKATSSEEELAKLIDSSRLIGGLPSSGERVGLSFNGQYNIELIEYLSFLDFYKKAEDNASYNITNYSFPLNVKTEVINYYDTSRKLNLDNYINELNGNGFAVIDNPFADNNFYNIYDELYKNKIPVLITSDFLIYYYQQIFKKAFKDIEENIFYNNLWEINYFLYEKAKSRYEDGLNAHGNVNDRVLEAKRLAAAYFATSLELLKPSVNQINANNDLNKKLLFTKLEAENYTFTLPDYLKIDVEKEVALIKGNKSTAKSPVLLYERSYNYFVVPEEYKGSPKLNNFYLTAKWLSSNFPLFYKDENCPNCYLDMDDWRVSLITSSFIAKDIFDSYELKLKWARIYKTLAFFKGLRGDLTYVHYRDSLAEVFGADSRIEDIFSDSNPDSVNNLHKFRNKVLEYEFLDIEGGLDKSNLAERNKIGVKMLTDFYWPNDYILNELSYPNVSSYQNKTPAKNNITSCNLGGAIGNVRCNGFSLDVIALVDDKALAGNDYYSENSNYKNYQEELFFLKNQIEKFPSIWHYNNYWKTLNIIKEYLGNNKNNMPIFAQSSNWRRRELYTSVGSWVNLQLPADNLINYQKNQSKAAISSDKVFFDYNYIEPNLSLINEQISNVNMVLDMFKLLKITDELRTVLVSLEDLKNNLNRIKVIMTKELNSEKLTEEDLQFISFLSLEMRSEKAISKTLKIEGNNKKAVNYDINKSKLLILTSISNGIKSFSVGPVFSYIETR